MGETEGGNWVVGVNRLVVFARVLPQTTNDGLNLSLQKERQFVQCVTLGVGPLFFPL